VSGTTDVVERFAGRRRAVLLAAGACALTVALAGRGEPTAALGVPARDVPSYTLMQMNLCLSGFAACFGRVAYPAGVDDAAARIRAARPDAVTVNEACRGDVARIARQAGYHLRFSGVRTAAGPLRCVRPGGRGRFGDAVLTRAAVAHSDSHAFATQAGSERRRWLCVTTRAGVDVCTAHLATRSPVEVTGNEAQCAELATILARRIAARPVIFGGDVNRRRPCAPPGLWTRTDDTAGQAPSLQHAYGSPALRSPAARVVPARYTDHDVLVIRARAV
jgi:endonuclease/exonuclease/phosphatase family metal-dependent hydrolase